MKKLFSILVLAVFFLSLSSFSKINKEVVKEQLDCTGLMFDVFDAYYANGYTHYESYQAANWHMKVV